MSEIAFNQQGERIQLHERAVEILIRRFKNPGRPGGPEKVVGPNGLPLYVPRSIKMEDFLAAVRNVPGRYRGDQVDDLRRIIEGAEPLYIDVMDQEVSRREETDARDHVIVELGRANAAALTAMSGHVAHMLDAASNLIRAADGAQMPAREPLLPAQAPATPAAPTPPPVEEAPPASPLQTMIATTLGQAGPLIQHLILTRVLGLPPEVASKMIAGQLGTVPTPASPPTEAGASAPTTSPPPANGTSAAPSSASSSPAGPVGVDPTNPIAYVAHLGMIESLLSKREALIARELIAAMTGPQVDAWRAKVCAMSAPDAAAAIRAEIAAVEARKAKTGGAS